jgi:hypothetical protein
MTRRETTTRQAMMAAAARAGKQHEEPPGLDWRTVMLRVAGAGLLIAAGAIHLDLYLTGYRTIPVIGWLFLLQVIAAFGLGLAVLATGGRPVIAGRLAAAGGALFALATLGGYLLSVWTGLFGFTEVRTTAGLVTGVIEVAAFAVLATLALAPVRTDTAAKAPADGAAKAPAGFPPGSPGDHRGGSNCRRGTDSCRAGAAGSRRSRGQPSCVSHRYGPEDCHDRRDGGTDQRQRLHPVLVRPGHPSRVEMLRQLRRVLAPGDRHRRGQPGPARHGGHDHPDRRLPPAHFYNGHPLYTYIGDTAPARPRATTSTSTAAYGTRCASPCKNC